MAEIRPRTGIAKERSPRLVALLGILLLPLLVLSGCNTGSRNEPGDGIRGPDVDPIEFPELQGISPENGKPGDLITLTGRNFSSTIEDNVVIFTNFAGTIELRGVVESVNVGLFLPEQGAPSTMTVRVPTGVRSGFVSLSVQTADNGLANAGGRSFAAAPVVSGWALDADGLGFAILRDVIGGTTTNEIDLIGYNLTNNVTEVIFDDGTAVQTSNVIANGPAPGATYELPVGMEAITVELPANALIPATCDVSTIEITARALDGATLIGTSAPLEVPYALFNNGNLGDIPAYFTGVTIPTGVRAGDVTIGYNVGANPSVARWDAVFEYQDPSDPTGQTFLPCTPAPGTFDGVRVLPGTISGGSGAAGLVGPGADHQFVWDSRTDIAPGTGTFVTRIRMSLENAFPELGIDSIACAGDFLTGLIVVNNDAPTSGSILETFDDNENQDFGGNAAWNSVIPGALTGPATPAVPNYGTGTADVVLSGFGTYELDTDFGSIIDITDMASPIDLIPGNPGAFAGEFHVASLVIEDGATLVFSGSNPVIFRVSGDGNDNTNVVSLAGTLAFNGEDGTAGDPDNNGLGGAGSFAGGGDGGDGAFITTNPDQEVIELIPAQDGELNGGEGGPSATLVLAGNTTSTPRPGGGGGGGHDGPGEDAINSFLMTTNYSTRVGRGGGSYGDSAITLIRGGSGGGGGGAAPARFSASAGMQEKHGGGGGGGGGAFAVIARGSVRLLGTITCDGGSGRPGTANGGTQSGAGGGGAGGSILVRATGNIELGSEMVLSAIGGLGGVTNPGTSLIRGGNGADGRIRLEANGQLLSPGINQGDLMPDTGSSSVSVGVSTGTIFTGTGVDGPLNSSTLGSSGVFTVDTDQGRIFNSAGLEVFANSSGSGSFELTQFDLPAGVTLVGVGSNPLIFRVTGTADVRGVIDVSGQDGGLPDISDSANPVPGAGGLAGAGGGAGGIGGTGDNLMVITMPGAGEFPPTMPPQLISSSPPLGGGGDGGIPVPGNPAVAAQPGTSVVGDGSACVASSGGGGGYSQSGDDAFVVDLTCPDHSGEGGSPFGASFFLVNDPTNPTEPIELLVGGGGGAGGGGFTDGAMVVSGTGGGGAGGFVQISSGGQLKVYSSAQILAEGGDAFQAPQSAGNGGGGAGGAVRLRGQSRVEIEAGAVISVLAGLANQSNPAATYVENGAQTGGDGAVGRIRIETPLGFAGAGDDLAVTPAFTFGPFATAGLAERRAVSTPFRTSPDGSTVLSPVTFLDPIVNFLTPQPASTHVITLFEGAKASEANPGVPGAFSGPADNLEDLEGAEFIRLRVFLYSSPTESPEIDSIELPFQN